MNKQKTVKPEVKSPSSLRRVDAGSVIKARLETSHSGCDHSGCETGKNSRLETSHAGCGHSGCADGTKARLE